ncbi:MAG: GNAT family N-acetyltransferase [Acidobacteria bacterium]|nr:GNAT family N-acetyltransferase [Acidobacteriota bacterium]
MTPPTFDQLPETSRLRFRRFALRDESSVFEMFSDPYARRFYPEMADRSKARAWIEWNLHNYEQFGFGLWAVELKSSGSFIGDCGITFQEIEGKKELEIGYHVVYAARGNGYAKEAARACLCFAFRVLKAARVCSILRPENIASRAVARCIHSDCRKVLKRGRPALVFFTTLKEWEARLKSP